MEVHTVLCFGDSSEINTKQARGEVLCQVPCTKGQLCPSLARGEAGEGHHLHSWRLKSFGALADQSLMVLTVLFLYPGTGVS